MQRLRETAITVVITFGVTLLLNFLVDYTQRSRGAVSIGPPVILAGAVYLPLDLTNYENKPLNSIRITVPQYLAVNSIAASSPVTLSNVDGEPPLGPTKTIMLSGIEPRRSTKLLIRLEIEADWYKVRPQNHHELQLDLQLPEEVQNPIVRQLKSVLALALVYSVLLGFATWYQTGRLEAAQENAREVLKTQADLKDELAKVRSEMRVQSLRIQIYLLARLNDYSRELSFWRDTIRKLLTSGGSVPPPEKVVEQVTLSLRTFGTLDRKTLNDFEAIKVGAELLNREKRND